MARRQWSRTELLLAFNLYCKTPFGKIHIRNPQIIELAALLGRTPSAVSWKLANFSRLDTALKARNIAGAGHGAKADIGIWNEFHGNWEKLALESEECLNRLKGGSLQPVELEDHFPPGQNLVAAVKVRINQAFFRSAILAAYGSACCVTGISTPQLLIASHIVPWAIDEPNRTNPRNGLCLNAIHDRAFDAGLMTVTTDYRVKISSSLMSSDLPAIQEIFQEYEGKRITLPDRFVPQPEFLQFHSSNVFLH